MLRLAKGMWRSAVGSDRVNRMREQVIFGGERRRGALVKALVAHDKSLQYRQWRLSGEMPHFYDHRIGSLLFAAGEGSGMSLFRGFAAAQVMRSDDAVLDIGCGDGFFAHRLFAPRVAHVDSIDIESTAIDHARRHHSAPNITYHQLDAVYQAFPRPHYDVIVWDGALGHFAPDVMERMLGKIRGSLSHGGVFVGSETLGNEGHDHLQFFPDVDALRRLFIGHFDTVQLSQMEYSLSGDALRREAFWRCGMGASDRLELAAWR
jgi:2-polyprenyl-3-methyl-5-hydroxy-6-metoxy-1,4-benzoquinol methylase